MRKLILILAIAALSINMMAQQECAFVLEEAQEMFDAGLIETIPDKLSSCLKTGFTNEEQLQAYKLIILSYLFDDNIEEADGYMLQFLSEYPAYEPVATDPREFVLLMETYDTDPVLMLGGGFGANFSFPITTEGVGVHNVLLHEGNFVPGRAGFHGNFMVERQITPHFQLLGELAIGNVVFDNYLDDETDNSTPSAELTDFSIVKYYETQTQLRLPVSAVYYFGDSDFKPYIRMGLVPGVLLTAKAEAKRVYINTGNIKYDDLDVANVDVLPGRRMFNVWAFAGLGFSYKLGAGNFFMDVRYHANLLNQVKPGSDPYMFPDLVNKIYYVDDMFLLNNVTATAGYMFPLYRPKKKEQ